MEWNLMWLVVGVVLAMTVGRAAAIDGPICDDAVAQLVPCSDFLKNTTTAAPSAACCAAVQSLDKVAKLSKDYHIMLCQCLKDITTSFPINVVKARQLPEICHASNNIKFDANAKCDQVKPWV